MKVDIIDHLEAFQAVEKNWNSVYDSDPCAQFFLSWIWLDGTLKRCEEQDEAWLILAAKMSHDASSYVAFFPLRIGLNQRHGKGFYNELFMAGVTDSEHIGFICLPDYEEEAASTFATYIQQQETWSVLNVENMPAIDRRLNLLVKNFSGAYKVRERQPVHDLDQIDNRIVPYLSLPDNWEQYLQEKLSSNTRQKIKRLLRKIENSNEFHITYVNEENLEQHIEILLDFWLASWEGRKGPELCEIILDKMDFTLRHCFENRCLYFPVLWQGDKPLGAIANLIDFSKKSILFLIAGRDETVKDPPSGIILHAYGIQYAIQHGFKIYDFLIGNEAYKFSFGAQERRIKTMVIHNQKLVDRDRKLDIRTLPRALQSSVNYHRANRLVEAEQGYRQILDVQPQHPEALYNLAVVTQRQQDYQAAENLLRRLLEVQPHHSKAWFSLGTLHQIQNQLPEAEIAYQQALLLQPEASVISLAIYHNLGYTLQQQGKFGAAIACFQKALELQPDSIEADVSLANALHAQGQLSPEKRAHYATLNHDLGNKRQQAGDFKVAIEYYRQAIALNPDLVEVYCDLGLMLQKQDKEHWEEAIACYQKALELQPNNLEAEVGLANALHAQGQLSLEKRAHYAALNHDLGHQRQQVGDFKAATEYYHQAIALNPDSVEVYCDLGCVLQKQGQEHWEKAVTCYQKALELQPNSLKAEVGLANALYAQGQLSLEKEKRAYYAVLNCDLGNQHQQLGKLQVAIEHYQQAIALDPNLVEAHRNLRLALEAQGVKVKLSCAKQ